MATVLKGQGYATGQFGKNHEGDLNEHLPIPSWLEGENKTAILDFVKQVSYPDSENFVAIEDRIAVFF